MQFSPIGHTIISLPSIDSTNNYAANLLNETNVLNGTVIMAKNQTKGRGQRGNIWEVNPDENLTFSIVLNDLKLKLNHQFLISIWVSISVSHFLKENLFIENVIKWPNDILVNNQKICGVLIENSVRGDNISNSIVGVGLNVNQQVFSDGYSATSVKNIKGNSIDIKQILESLLIYLNRYYPLLKSTNNELLFEKYYECLLGYKKNINLKEEGVVFKGEVVSVAPTGIISIKKEDGETKDYSFKQISFIL